jgi:ATP-dependent RNA helicase DBP3
VSRFFVTGVFAEDPTISGKTLAFCIPALTHILSLPSPKASEPPISILILAPTRELALQTDSTLSSISTPLSSIASVCLFGGVPKDAQVKMLRNMNKDGRKTRVVVGTPGRVLDLVREGECDLSQYVFCSLLEHDIH